MLQAVQELLAGVVDYAGLFPPANLPLDRVVRNYAAYLQGESSWMLGRLIVPIDQLECTAKLAATQSTGDRRWQISCLLGSSDKDALRDDVQQLQSFNQIHAANAETPIVVDAVELKTADLESIDQIASTIPTTMETFIELPPVDEQFPMVIAHLARQNTNHLRAKYRTGGVLETMIPSTDSLANFIRHCAVRSVPFKLTAGLHHPIRAVHPLTYDSNADTASMHGFLNVLLATAMLYDASKRDSIDADALLKDEEAAQFVAEDQHWHWKGNTISLQQIQLARQNGMLSFGSCSFVEPTEELAAMGISPCCESPIRP